MGRRFGRRKELSPDEHTRRAALSSKSFRNRLGRGSNKESLLTKAGEIPDSFSRLPTVGTDRTDAVRSKLEQRAAAAHEKSRRKSSRRHSLFGKRMVQKVDVDASEASGSLDASDSAEADHNGNSMERHEFEAEAEPLDILRTARISKKNKEGDISQQYSQVEMTAYGSNWATDSFALLQNAIKAEIRDLYSIAYVMQRRKMWMTLTHIDVFYEWWMDFSEFLNVAITVEEQVYFKWVASKDYLRGPFKQSERMRVNGSTRKTIQNIMEYKQKFLPYLPVGERLEGLLVHIGEFDQLLKHYAHIGSTLPGYLQTLFTKKEKDANLKEMIAAFRNSDGYNRNLVLLAKWMPDRMMKRWALSHLRTKDLISFKGWRTMITREHCNLARQFEDIVMGEEDASGEAVIGSSMAINEEMRDHIDRNRVSVRATANGIAVVSATGSASAPAGAATAVVGGGGD